MILVGYFPAYRKNHPRVGKNKPKILLLENVRTSRRMTRDAPLDGFKLNQRLGIGSAMPLPHLEHREYTDIPEQGAVSVAEPDAFPG